MLRQSTSLHITDSNSEEKQTNKTVFEQIIQILKLNYTLKDKEVCHKIFDLHFFMSWAYLFPWQTGIFEFFVDFAKIFKFFRNSACGPWSQTPWCASHHRVKWSKLKKNLCYVHHTAVSSFAVCILPRSQALRCTFHRWVKIKIFVCFWLLLKGKQEILLGVNRSILHC